VSAQAAPKGGSGVTCNLPESDAEALVILNNFYPNRYAWDHTDLTVYVEAQPGVSEEYLAAISGAIETWNAVLLKCFDGLITLTEVDSRQEADIVVHYVPTAGGAVFAGYAICGAQGCPNILVRSDLPPSWGVEPYDPEYLGWVTLHELGHALGLGHATNLLESTDLMGYGWIGTNDAVLSQCDVEALAFVFAWALEGVEPYPPAEGPYVC
jgi:predicted Zn-dependent protease